MKGNGPIAPQIALRTFSFRQGRALCAFVALAFALSVFAFSACAQPEDTRVLQQRIGELFRSGEYDEAAALAQRYLDITRAEHGEEHPDVAVGLGNLALIYRTQGRYTEAEPLYKRALALGEKLFGATHPEVATILDNLAGLYSVQGRYSEAEPLYKRALAILEEAYGVEDPDVATRLNNLAFLYYTQGRYSEAEPLYERARAMLEKAHGTEHPDVATTVNNLAQLYSAQGRFAEAELHYKLALAIQEKVLGANHPDFAISLNNLAMLFYSQNRYADAAPLFKRAIAVLEKVLGSEHPSVAVSLVNLAVLYSLEGRYDEAEPLHKRALTILEKVLGAEHPQVATSINNLAVLYLSQRRFAEAEPLVERTLAIREKALGAEHPDLAVSLGNLAFLYYNQDRLDDAAPLFRRALEIQEAALGADHPQVAIILSSLAILQADRGNWTSALAYLRRSAQILTTRMRRTGDAVGEALTGLTSAAGGSLSHAALAHMLRLLVDEGGGEEKAIRGEAFVAAQRAQASDAAKALARMTARFATGNDRLSAVVRERQDLVSEWQTLDVRLIAAVSSTPEKRVAESEAVLRAELARIDGRITEIDQTLGAEFPDYAQLANPEPLTIEVTRKLLNDDEALLVFFDAPPVGRFPAETLVWALTKNDIRWVRIPVGTEALTEWVRRLRHGFGVGRTRGAFVKRQDEAFALDTAHDLYTELLEPIAGLINGRALIIVPSGSLTSLPWHFLISKPSDAGSNVEERLSELSWLVRDHAVTVLPSVSSLAALRRTARVSAAPEPFLGIGNPLLVGPDGDDVRAVRFATCSDWKGGMPVAERRGLDTITSLFRGAYGDIDKVRLLAPLPETTGELCGVASSLGAPESGIVLGANATETNMKALSAKGRLDDYRVVHFATHGLVAGELDGLAEPALVLTPPDEATAEDDGLLTASEVAQLKLDADWVVLSACNTAAGDDGNAEALSGLARAFFYAGARALLVSHWPVNSQAAVELTTKAFEELEASPEIGRAEALRRAMLSLIDSGDRTKAHPAYWAPFVVVGQP